MNALRSARLPAILLLVAAALGLAVANSPLASWFAGVRDTHIAIPGTDVDLSVGHWVSDGLLAVFFLVAAIELRHELTKGSLREPRRAVVPAIAAAGGVVVPIALYLAVALGSDASQGWPIPTATDIAFALGVLALFGRGLPPAVRAFLLALAILDDIVGIVFIAVLFTNGVDLMWLGIAAGLVVVFAAVSHIRPKTITERPLWMAFLVGIGLATWGTVLLSGVHATIAGVALGFAMAPRPANRLRKRMEPWVNAIVLPVFAFFAAAVTIPAVTASQLSPAFWGILVALPVGKLVGITLFGWVAQRMLGTAGDAKLAFGDLVAAGALGGIGFTVSLLLAQLAFGAGEVGAQATLAVLGGSAVSMVLSGVLVSARARSYRRAAQA